MDRKKLSKGGISFIIMGAVMLIIFFITVGDLVYSQNFKLPIRAYVILLLMILIPIFLLISGISIRRNNIKLFSITSVIIGVMYLFYYASKPLSFLAYNRANFDYFIQNGFGWMYASVAVHSLAFILLGSVALSKKKKIILAYLPVAVTILAIFLLIPYLTTDEFVILPARFFALTGRYPAPLYIIENLFKIIGFDAIGEALCKPDVKKRSVR
ncbi:hypothetical protein SAMN02910370_02530 [Lachnospiraceae bacterium XPB1003]|nr:hypothetical protein SAMN02910370_02530 [Lachnospiraceae bacterium XPB1003]